VSEARLLGEFLLELGLVNVSEVAQALEVQAKSGERLGDVLVALGFIRRDQLHSALAEQLGLNEKGTRLSFGDVLVRLKHLTQEQLDTVREKQKTDDRKVGEIAIELGFCSYKQVYEALSLHRQPGARYSPSSAEVDPSRVMVVDDSPLACELVEQGLRALGYHVDAFQNPFEALEQVTLLKPAIILSDLDMPGMSGEQLCVKLKEGPAKSTPVLILTANDEQASKVAGLRAGADDYVNKSVSMAELGARIESIVRRTGATERMRRLFARYTSDAVVDEVLKSGDIVLTGEKRVVTTLFADIRDFTRFSETEPAEVVVALLNEVLGRLSDAVLTCGGTLDKFLGDGLMAVFGAPVNHPDAPLRAVQAARMMMASIHGLASSGKGPPGSHLMQLGVGINTGEVVAGSLGSTLRSEYTCIGDSVNVASRLCALAGPMEILVGQETRNQCGPGGRFEALPDVTVKGKSQKVKLFRTSWR
jgi:adenylate cyclase